LQFRKNSGILLLCTDTQANGPYGGDAQIEEVSYLPNIKSAAKRAKLSKARNSANKAKKSALKTVIKKFDAAVAEGNKAAAAEAYSAAVKTVDQAAAKGIVHKNNAARKKSRLTKSLNAMV
jgi:small subunit ribosomal protein S20